MPRRIALQSRPQGLPRPEDFRIEDYVPAEPGDGEIAVANLFLSMDPAIRGFLDDRPSYLPPLAIGAPIRGMTLGRVERSRRADMPEGTVVRALADWSEVSALGRDALGLERVEVEPGVKLQSYMGALGPVGLTAWVGLTEIGQARSGETVVVSAAAGATGSIVGQIARLRGCRVVGLVGSQQKAERALALGFHEAVNYREMPDLAAAIGAACPDGVDVYFDNVGGETLELMLPLMREHGRVVVCGMIAQYNDADRPYGVKTLWQLVVKRLTMRGFLTYDHADRLGEAAEELRDWVRDGRITPIETIYHGLEQAPLAFIDLMSAATMGKVLVALDGSEEMPR
ncbi:MAG TPA: NADP-dependent oxidoreductase [Stellaceae bacterium]|nr:NADP-dependent oxidoreductase [Stellaceae bacterium]